MADNKLDLPGDFQAGKRYVLKGETLIDWKKQIEADRALPGPGLKESDTGVGRMFRVIFPPSKYPPFSLKEIEENNDDYDLLFEPGRVSIANPVQAANGGDGYEYFVPEIDGHPMDEKLPSGEFPKLTVSDGQGVYCKINRNEQGLVIPPVELVAEAQDEDSDHYQPDDPAGDGNESEHDLKRILYLDLDDGEIEIKVWRESDIDIEPFLWTGENVGGGAEIFKDHDETQGIYRFRTPSGCWGAKVEVDGDSVVVEVEAENVGMGETAAAATLLIEKDEEDPGLEICDQKMKIKALGQGVGADERQIRITDGDEIVRIHGNGKDGSIRFQNCDGGEIFTLFWEDGLITSENDHTIVVGDCSDTTPTT